MNKYHYTRFACAVVFLASSFLYGQWGLDQRLTYNDSISSTFLNYAWCIAVVEDTVHIVWQDNRDGNWEIYYIRSIDGGLSWGLDTSLSEHPDNSIHPAIGVHKTMVHLVWTDERDGPPS